MKSRKNRNQKESLTETLVICLEEVMITNNLCHSMNQLQDSRTIKRQIISHQEIKSTRVDKKFRSLDLLRWDQTIQSVGHQFPMLANNQSQKDMSLKEQSSLS